MSDPLTPHDHGCRCWPHVGQREAIEASIAAARAEYAETKRVREIWAEGYNAAKQQDTAAAIRDYLASPAAEKALAEALAIHRYAITESIDLGTFPTATLVASILAAWVASLEKAE